MRRTKRICISQNKKAFLFLAPSLIGVAVFILIPFMDVVMRSFHQAVGGKFVGMYNYIDVCQKLAFRLAVKNTLHFILVCIPLLMGISLGIALLVNGIQDGGFYKTSILLPMAVPIASIVLLWKLVFSSYGVLNQVMELWGKSTGDWMRGERAFSVLVFTYLWKNTGYDMVLWLAGLSGIAKELYEAARVDGAGAWQRFRYITLPGLGRTSMLVAVLSLVNSFKVFREAYLIAGDYPHDTIYMLQHLFNNWFVSLDIQKMSAASVMLETVILVPVILWCVISGKRRRK